MGKFVPSSHQKDIFKFIKNGEGNAIISAVAGSGKTTTLLKSLETIPEDKNVLFLAFNKSIADELKDRVPKSNNIVVKTVHGFGYSTLMGCYNNMIVDNKKYNKLLREILSFNQGKDKTILKKYKFTSEILELVKKMSKIKVGEDVDLKKYFSDVMSLTSLGRLHFLNVSDKTEGINTLKELASIHSIDDMDGEPEMAWYLTKIGTFCTDSMDYTDMIYLPNVMNLITDVYDFVFIDECQDLNTCQRMLMEKAIKPTTGRFIAVGDPKQAIYGFAGADYKSFKKLCEIPNTIQLPLSVTYRCGSEIVKQVKHINEQIISHTKNKKGEVLDEFSYKNIQDGDMVLCRQTFPVVSLCVRLLSEGKKAYIIGSDIGLSLVTMIKDCEKITEEFNMKNVFSRLYNEKNKLVEKLMNNNNISMSEAIEEPLVILYKEKVQVIEALSVGIDNPTEVIDKINQIFSDKKKVGICLSSIHKSKGLEAERVFILHRELLISKYAVLPWQLDQEHNLTYVGFTRAKSVLGFITDYDAWEKHPTQSKNITKISESKHVGSVGMKMNFDLEVLSMKSFTGQYGETTIFEMKDKNNNIFSKFGSVDERFLVNRKEKKIEVGSKVTFYGIIKQHSEFKGNKVTQLGKISQY